MKGSRSPGLYFVLSALWGITCLATTLERGFSAPALLLAAAAVGYLTFAVICLIKNRKGQ